MSGPREICFLHSDRIVAAGMTRAVLAIVSTKAHNPRALRHLVLRRMTLQKPVTEQAAAEADVDEFRRGLGPFVVAAETTRMAMVFTNANDPDNPIIFANDSFVKLSGYPRDAILGQHFRFLMAHVTDTVAFAQIEAGFKADPGHTFEIECRRKDGRQFLAAIYISPVRDERGQVVQHFASFIDLTDHIERLRKERDALHALYQHAPGLRPPTDPSTGSPSSTPPIRSSWDIARSSGRPWPKRCPK